ncbi:MAG: EAL domain-containing protein [Alphaproteobacteria bacterium]|nr:EAL domain-containing protein [Alphaproteobacteria bacterium]
MAEAPARSLATNPGAAEHLMPSVVMDARAGVLVIHPGTGAITAASPGAMALIDCPPAALGRSARESLPAPILSALTTTQPDQPVSARYARADHRLVELRCSHVAAGIAVELRLLEDDLVTPEVALAALGELARASSASADGPSFLAQAVGVLRRGLGFDRVFAVQMVDRGAGQVLAVDQAADWPDSIAGLRFPASDMPIARHAPPYRLRHLSDALAAPLPLDSLVPLARQGLDGVQGRSTGPRQRRLLAALGVRGCFVQPLVVEDSVWGFLIGHHRTARPLSLAAEQMLDMVRHVTETHLRLWTMRCQHPQDVRLESLHRRFLESLASSDDLFAKVTSAGTLLPLFDDVAGVALVIFGMVITDGLVPHQPSLQRMIDHLLNIGIDGVWATDRLSDAVPDYGVDQPVAGALAIAIGEAHQTLIVWFRAPRTQVIPWAGNPNDRHRLNADGDPIRFDGWLEHRTDQAFAWTRHEVYLADRLRHAMSDLVFTQHNRLVTLQSRLTLARRQLDHQANHDPLTGLPTRSLLEDRLGLAISSAEGSGARVAVMVLDLDRFKLINDTLGHDLGDRLLMQVARDIEPCLRRTDTLARLSGDEFLLVLPGIDGPSAVERIAQKLMAAISTPREIDNHDVSLSCSIGITVCPDDGQTISALLRQADVAMSAAKDAGRGTYRFFSQSMRMEIERRHRFASALRRAIDEDQLALFYQPQFDLVTTDLVGLEALIRWQSPDLGPVSPSVFIPLAEELGLINRIGAWVIEEACRQQRAWIDQGLETVPVAVNVSGVQFGQDHFAQCVLGALAHHGVPPELLVLEITEGVLVQGAEKVVNTLKQLRSGGILIALDDFGTGYSSLSYLKRFPIDKLKIDQSFVRDLTTDSNDEAIARAIVALGHSLGLRVIAEGIENAGHADHLIECGCHEGQGYWFARPADATDTAHILADRIPPAWR